MTEESETYEDESPKAVDENGKVLTQRKIDINAPIKRRKSPGRPPKMIKVYNKINAKIFLHEGRTLGPRAEGEVSKADLEMPNIKASVVVMG